MTRILLAILLFAGCNPSQTARQGDPAAGGTGAAVAPRLLGERRAADDASSGHGSASRFDPLAGPRFVTGNLGEMTWAGARVLAFEVAPGEVPISARERPTACVVTRRLGWLVVHPVSLLLRLSALSVTHLSSECNPTPRSGQPDNHPGAPTASPVPGRITPSPTIGKRPASTEAPRTAATLRGIASTYGPGWDGWLALPAGPGIRVEICGAGGCVVRTSTDAGPSLAMQRRGRVADLDVATFELVCGVPWTRGLCRVSVEIRP